MYEYEKSVDLLNQLQKLRIDIINEVGPYDGTILLDPNLGRAAELLFTISSLDDNEKIIRLNLIKSIISKYEETLKRVEE